MAMKYYHAPDSTENIFLHGLNTEWKQVVNALDTITELAGSGSVVPLDRDGVKKLRAAIKTVNKHMNPNEIPCF